MYKGRRIHHLKWYSVASTMFGLIIKVISTVPIHSYYKTQKWLLELRGKTTMDSGSFLPIRTF